MDGLFSDEELFLTQNSFSEERVEDNFSIDSILYGLVACDEPVSQNSCGEELKQVVTEKSIKDGRTDPSNYPEAVRKIVIVDDEELEKRKESRIPANTRINTSWAVRAWSEWALERNGMIAIRGETGITLPEVNPDILNITHNEELNYWLSKFVVEVRKKKDPGTFYPPNTLYQLCCGICFAMVFVLLKRGIYTDKSLIYNAIQFISPALPCYIIKPSPDFQLV